MIKVESSPIRDCLAAINAVFLGKEPVVKLALAALLAQGSVLIQDKPGLGKTTLAKTLSKVLGLPCQRIQCTNDLLPMDILGRLDYTVPQKPTLIEGPIFASLVMLDELNRAPARTQSAFLQAMEEGQVTLEGHTYQLPRPQMFIATQNPSDQVGTSLLPESELDRFTLHLQLGYPDEKSERSIIKGLPQGKLLELTEVLNHKQILTLQKAALHISVSDTFIDLVIRLLAHARNQGVFLSPRAGRDLVRISQGMALIDERNHVIPDDLKTSVSAVIGHRINQVKGADAIIQTFQFQA
jgi:MoxR-like ATPase